MKEEPVPHMTAGEFRRHGHGLVDWIAAYWDRVETLPVLSPAGPGDVLAALPDGPPERGEPFEAVMADVERVIMPGLTHWQSPSFFGFFPANVSAPAVLGELLSAGLGVQGMLWATSPACTELEVRVLDWLLDMLGLPGRFRSTSNGGGVIQDTASSATLCALLAARERHDAGVPLRVYASAEAHSSVQKAVRIAGLGPGALRLVETDERFAMRPEALRRAVEDDLARGERPCFVSATVGTTSSNGLDPLVPIGGLCREHEIWLHVDAAMSGTAALCPELRFIHEGLELADSYCVNPHKWMLTNFDCDCFWVADRAALIRALSVTPEYLRNRASESGEVFDFRDWHVPLGRRFRALKLWFVIRHYGVEGLRAHVRNHVALAQDLAARIEADDRLELAVPAPLNLICFRHRGGEEPTRTLLERLNGSGRMYLTHTRLHDRLTIRLCIGATLTRPRHVEAAWQAIRQEARRL